MVRMVRAFFCDREKNLVSESREKTSLEFLSVLMFMFQQCPVHEMRKIKTHFSVVQALGTSPRGINGVSIVLVFLFSCT